MIKATNREPAQAAQGLSFDPTSPLPEGKAKQDLVRSMFDSIAPRYDLVNFLMTFGLDARWRGRTIEMLHLSPGSVVLDIGCGTADLARSLLRKGHRPVGSTSPSGCSPPRTPAALPWFRPTRRNCPSVSQPRTRR